MSGSHFHAVFPSWLNNDFQLHQRHGFSQDHPGRFCTFKLPLILVISPFTRPAWATITAAAGYCALAKQRSTAQQRLSTSTGCRSGKDCTSAMVRSGHDGSKVPAYESKAPGAMAVSRPAGRGMIWVVSINRIRPPALIMRAQGFTDATGGQ